MRVRVYVPSYLSDKNVDENGYMTLQDGATLNDVLKRLGVPLPLRGIIYSTVNYKRVKLKTKIRDGDIIRFIMPQAGG